METQRADGLVIPIVAGVGEGRTELSAFDAALAACGVLNFNLIRLSSVIPPGSMVIESACAESPPTHHGDRLYVVMAEQRSCQVGAPIAAGIGWYQWGDGRGVFVEHESEGEVGQSTVQVETVILDLIYASIRDLCAARNVPFDPLQVGSRLTSTVVGPRPAAAVVLAPFRREGW